MGSPGHVGGRPVVDEERCLGYGFCETRAPKVFEVDGQSLSRVRTDFAAAATDDVAAIDGAIGDCPMGAISWPGSVTAR